MQTLVLSLDFINEIVHPDGKSSGDNDFSAQIEKANLALAWARKEGHLIGHVRVGFSKSYAECPMSSPAFSKAKEFGAYTLGEWGTEFHEGLDVQESDFVVTKHRISPFYSTDLDALLRANRVERLVLFGVSTSMVVETCARDGHDRDYLITVVPEACGDLGGQEKHDAALMLIERLVEFREVGEL